MTPHTPSLPPQVQHAPAAFVQNHGQAPAATIYQSTALGYRLEITARGAVLHQNKHTTELQFQNAAQPEITPEQPLAAKFHLYRGQTRKENLPMYGAVRQRGIYPGIDAVFYGSQSNLEYDFVIHPKADPARIRFSFGPGATVKLTPDGALEIATAGHTVRQLPPLAFQRIQGQDRKVDARYQLAANGELSFQLGAYDPAQPLTIDPVLSPFGNLAAAAIAGPRAIGLDSQNNVYVSDGPDTAKFNPQGTLVYQFHVAFGGIDFTEEFFANSLAVAADQSVAIGGATSSRDLPTTSASFQRYKNLHICPPWPSTASVACLLAGELYDAFVIKLNPNGTLHWASYLGGNDRDIVHGIAFGPGGKVYVGGETKSSSFPSRNEFQDCSLLRSSAFFAVLSADGAALPYASCLHPNSAINRNATAFGLAVDAAGNGYIAGSTNAGPGEFPVRGANGTAPFQSSADGGFDGFFAKFNPNASGNASLVYSTLIGGAADDQLFSVTLESAGTVCASGHTASADYPRRSQRGTGVSLNLFTGPTDLVVSCLTANGDALSFSNVYGVKATVVGDSRLGQTSIALDPQAGLHVTTRAAGSFTAVNPVGNAGGSGTGAYLQLDPLRAVTILTHTPENTITVATDTSSIPFFANDGPVRKFDNQCAADLTSRVQVVQGNVIFDIATNRFKQSVTLRNVGLFPLPAGARFVLTGLPQGVAVFQPAGVTECFPPAGTPFVALPSLPPLGGGFVTIDLEFTSQGNGVFYTPKIASPTGGV